MQLNIFGQVSERWIVFCFYAACRARSVVCCIAAVSLLGDTPQHTSILLMLFIVWWDSSFKAFTVAE
jgi:hypothetical protein